MEETIMEENAGVSIASGSKKGTSKKSRQPNVVLDENYINKMADLYKKTSKKHSQMLTEKELKPIDFHLWGILNKIKEKSRTLSNLVDTNGVKYVVNCKETFNTILSELGLNYEITRFKTKKPEDKAFVYDIHSVPRWSFYGIGVTDNEAINIAAGRGLEFFVELST